MEDHRAEGEEAVGVEGEEEEVGIVADEEQRGDDDEDLSETWADTQKSRYEKPWIRLSATICYAGSSFMHHSMSIAFAGDLTCSSG